MNAVAAALPPTRRKFSLLFPFSAGAQAALVRREGQVEKEEYRADGLYMEAVLDVRYFSELIKEYAAEETPAED